MARPLDPREAAALLKMKPRTLVKWARLKQVPAHPMGEGRRHIWMFFEEELIAWLTQRTNGGKHDAR